ncbi:hypothetical protein HO657_05965 [Streptococcus suis]|nr:hypothetical protein [Streptococcus suis]
MACSKASLARDKACRYFPYFSSFPVSSKISGKDRACLKLRMALSSVVYSNSAAIRMVSDLFTVPFAFSGSLSLVDNDSLTDVLTNSDALTDSLPLTEEEALTDSLLLTEEEALTDSLLLTEEEKLTDSLLLIEEE